MRECDAGARVLRLVYRKYACQLAQHVELGRMLGLHAADAAAARALGSRLGFLNSLIGAARVCLAVFDGSIRSALAPTPPGVHATPGIMEAEPVGADGAPMLHGLLMSLRYCLMEQPAPEVLVAPATPLWRQLLDAACALLLDAFEICTRAISADVEGADAEATGDRDGVPIQRRIDGRGHIISGGSCDDEDDVGVGDEHGESDVVSRGAWLVVREVATAFAQLVGALPLERDDGGSDSSADGWRLRASFVADFGHALVSSLCRVQQHGAVKHAGAALASVASALQRLGAGHASLRALPAGWLRGLLDLIETPAACVQRRSAGYGLAVQCLVASEPPAAAGASRGTVHATMQFLLGRAGPEGSSGSGTVRARVVALNVLRLLFADARLCTDTLMHVPSALEAAFNGFGAGEWAVRNSSMMLYVAVVNRCARVLVRHAPAAALLGSNFSS